MKLLSAEISIELIFLNCAREHKIVSFVFREPEGRKSGLIFLAVASFALLYVIYNQIRFGGGINPAVSIGVPFTLLGLAELLPKNKKRLAGGTRIAAVVICISLIIYI